MVIRMWAKSALLGAAGFRRQPGATSPSDLPLQTVTTPACKRRRVHTCIPARKQGKTTRGIAAGQPHHPCSPFAPFWIRPLEQSFELRARVYADLLDPWAPVPRRLGDLEQPTACVATLPPGTGTSSASRSLARFARSKALTPRLRIGTGQVESVAGRSWRACARGVLASCPR